MAREGLESQRPLEREGGVPGSRKRSSVLVCGEKPPVVWNMANMI